MTEDLRAALLGTVLAYCKAQGMTPQQVCAIFNRKTIYGGFEVLNKGANQ